MSQFLDKKIQNDDFQVVYLDFDGELTQYNNSDLGIDIVADIQNSEISLARQMEILETLTEQYQGTNIRFTIEKPVDNVPYSTVYIGQTDAFDSFGNFAGLAETIDKDNKIKNDDAFVFADAATDTETIISVISHELGHIVGGEEHSISVGTLEDYAATVTDSGYGNSFSTADYLGYVDSGLSYCRGTLSSYTDYDYFYFYAGKTGTLSLAEVSSSFGYDVNLRLYNSSQTLVKSASGYGPSLSYYVSYGEKYYIKIDAKDNYSNYYGTYSIRATISGSSTSHDLTYSTPSGWSGSIVVSTTTDTNTNASRITTADNVYVDYALINSSSYKIYSSFTNKLYLDGTLIRTWTVDQLDANKGKAYEDTSLGKLSAGSHTLRWVIDSGYSISESNENNNIATKTFTVYNAAKPDLTVSSFSLSKSSISSAEAVTLNYTVANTGSAVASGFWIYIYDGSEEIYSGYRYADVNAGGSYNASYTINAGKLSAGTHTLKVKVDATNIISESNENNNVSSRTLSVTAAKPDLAFTSMSLSKSSATTADAVTVNFTVKNKGNSRANSSKVAVYDGNTKLGTVDIYWLDPNETCTRSYTIAAGQLSAGSHSIQIKADASFSISESDENNNVATRTLSVTAAKPDLAFTSMSLSKSSATTADAVTVNFTVKNKGNSRANSSKVAVYDGNTKLGTVDIYWLDPNETCTRSYTIAAGQLSAGSHSIQIKADASFSISESDENNNVATRTLSVTAAKPDLAFTSMSLSKSSATTAEAVTINFTVKNKGNGASNATKAAVYDGSTKLGVFQLDALGAGKSKTYSYTVAAGKLSAGTHNLKVKLDASATIQESNENNNEATRTLTVTAGLPDLAFNGMTLSKSSVTTSEAFTVSFTVKNNGKSASKATRTALYDGTTKLQVIDMAALGAGKSATYSFNIPGGKLAAGTHNLKIMLDASSSVKESNENNNSATRTLTVTAGLPDLAFNGMTLSKSSVTTSEAFTVSFTVKNNGKSASKATRTAIYDGNTKLQVIDMAALGAGKSATYSFNIPGGKLAAGTHNLKIMLDASSSVKESNENNNSATRTLTVTGAAAGLPDLAFNGMTLSKSSVTTSEAFTVSFIVKNNGKTASQATRTAIYDGNTKLQVIEMAALGAGQSATYSFNIPAGKLAAGTHNLKIMLDASSSVKESNENNNTATRALTVTSAAAGLPDLTVTGMAFDGNITTCMSSDTVTGVFYIKNQGTAAAHNVNVAMVAYDPEAPEDQSLVILAENSISVDFPADQQKGYKFTLNASDFFNGPQYIGVIVDSTFTIDESDEDNNIELLPLTVISTGNMSTKSEWLASEATAAGVPDLLSWENSEENVSAQISSLFSGDDFDFSRISEFSRDSLIMSMSETETSVTGAEKDKKSDGMLA